MVETTTQTLKPTIKKYPVPPLKLFQKTFCQHCSEREYCRSKSHDVMMRNCILCLIADELARTRQLLQQRTQHYSW